jgi:hypothetical protein
LGIQNNIHGLGSLPMERRREMTIGVERQPDGAVPEQILHDLWVRPGLQQDARGRVAEVMHADMWKSGLP